jgi:hypothetical protein
MKCQKCHRGLADDETVYRFQGAAAPTTDVWCDACAGLLASPVWRWRDPLPCEGCGRPVSYRDDRRYRFHVSCGQPSCLRAIRAVAARARRRLPRVCICGTEFKPTRGDARYCSSRCRQRAYRLRLAVTPLATSP